MNWKRRSLIALVLAATFVAPAGVSYALWSATATTTMTVSISSPSPTALASPSNLRCTGGRGQPSVLHWDGAAGATGYKIYRPGSTNPLRTVPAQSVSASFVKDDMGDPIEPSEKYDLIVKTYNSSGESPGAPFRMQFKSNAGCAG